MTWNDGKPPDDMGDIDKLWVVIEVPTLYSRTIIYDTVLWFAGRWCDKGVSRATRWAILDVPPDRENARYVARKKEENSNECRRIASGF